MMLLKDINALLEYALNFQGGFRSPKNRPKTFVARSFSRKALAVASLQKSLLCKNAVVTGVIYRIHVQKSALDEVE
ncbi:hypothetical protein BTI06_07235 [Lactobacillus delbrueckii subsp. bulgaricus]|nr:hypothetical protein [Lactobacillus delbrueckii subsp. bulgaricus]MBT8843418.1 hypothetical protein [Lactobacillus delbrueckii subsp. bulgaricus]